jgi:tight adherence protein C
MADLPTVVLVAAGCLALALPLLAWAFTASPDAARKRALANLNRDLQAARSRLSQPQTDQDALDGLARRLTPRGGWRLPAGRQPGRWSGCW